jgi:hypothetical protein
VTESRIFVSELYSRYLQSDKQIGSAASHSTCYERQATLFRCTLSQSVTFHYTVYSIIYSTDSLLDTIIYIYVYKKKPEMYAYLNRVYVRIFLTLNRNIIHGV